MTGKVNEGGDFRNPFTTSITNLISMAYVETGVRIPVGTPTKPLFMSGLVLSGGWVAS